MKNKIILLLGVTFFVAGCTNIAKFIPSSFDGVEFDRLAELKVVSSSPLVGDDWCRAADINRMQFLSEILLTYSTYTLNQNITEVYAEINSLTTELKQAEEPSPVYCKLKRENINVATTRALEVFGKRVKK